MQRTFRGLILSAAAALRSSGCRSLVWNWRSAAFLPNTLKTSKSCSSKLSGCFRKYLKRSIYYGL